MRSFQEREKQMIDSSVWLAAPNKWDRSMSEYLYPRTIRVPSLWQEVLRHKYSNLFVVHDESCYSVTALYSFKKEGEYLNIWMNIWMVCGVWFERCLRNNKYVLYTVIIHHLLLHRLTGWITQQSKYQNRTKKTVAWELTVLRQCVDVDGLTSLIHHIKIDTKNTMTVRTKYKGGCIHCDIVIDLREGRRKEERKEEKMAVSTNQCVSLSLSLSTVHAMVCYLRGIWKAVKQAQHTHPCLDVFCRRDCSVVHLSRPSVSRESVRTDGRAWIDFCLVCEILDKVLTCQTVHLRALPWTRFPI